MADDRVGKVDIDAAVDALRGHPIGPFETDALAGARLLTLAKVSFEDASWLPGDVLR